MAGREEILKRWNFPHRQDHGVTLVARQNAAACVERIVRSGCRFYGYDSFIVRGESIQPVMEFSPDWSNGPVPPLQDILAQLASHPNDITDYEFVFEDAE
jgi:hypothetical protein